MTSGTVRKLALLAGTVAVVAAIVALRFADDTTASGSSGSGPEETTAPDGVVVHEVEQDPGDAAAYWTPERMRDAKPAPMPVLEDD
jgi:hypothetical protein